MVLWQCELRQSKLAQRLSLLLHGAVMLALLLPAWPASAGLVRMLLLVLVLLECIRSRRRIRRRQGDVALLGGHALRWRQREWRILSRPWLTRQAILLSLRDAKGERERLWLFADGMADSHWRRLRMQLLNNKEQGNV
ncbi:protein YgfX [Erwinia pyrifoliae]|uniref:protein YgfX n=1 Tax=Erwinia pyrifoliae TaxID=79967 RepID=UPI00223BA7CC|nr:protein YgfX [Erwinia pyrifoliae]MCT2386144.1 protein YgfX [Erwinia pyrifoliae]MCU8588259.1 protein YgfX [Erwinia pyrifoliae]